VDCEWARTDPDFFVRAPESTPKPYTGDTYHPDTGLAYGSCGWGAWQCASPVPSYQEHLYSNSLHAVVARGCCDRRDTLQLNIWKYENLIHHSHLCHSFFDF